MPCYSSRHEANFCHDILFFHSRNLPQFLAGSLCLEIKLIKNFICRESDDFTSMSLLGSDAVRQIDFLRRQYLQRVDPEQLTLPAISTLRLPEVQAEIHRTIFDDNLHSFPPPQRYKFRVLKRIVHVLEESIIDPEEHVSVS